MFCPNCGTRVSDDAMFCTDCGAALDASAQQPSVTTAQAAPATQMPSPQAYPGNARGCFGSAWDDVRTSPGHFGKLLLLGLIMLVPILNFVFMGYALTWTRDLALGRREPLPAKIVTGENFKIGFFAFVVNLVAMIIIGIEAFVLSFIPFVGTFAAFALLFFSYPFVNLALVRIGVFGSIGEGFAVGKIMDAYKRRLSKALGVVICPSLVAFGFELIVGIVFFVVMFLLRGVGFSSAAYMMSDPSSAALSLLTGASVLIMIASALASYITLVITCFLGIITVRGAGHYINRFVPEWASEVAFKAQQNAALYNSQQVYAPTVVPVQQSVPPQSQPQPQVDSGVRAYQPPDNYASDETSVLPEYPEELDTIVQPEGSGAYVPQHAVQPVQPQQGAQYDDSDTTVLSQGNVMSQTNAGQQKALQLTRSNGDTCVLSVFPVTIGKGSEADLTIDDNSTISRVHVRILRDGNVFAAEDLGSTNKTFINGFELAAHAPTILSDGDELKLANESIGIRLI